MTAAGIEYMNGTPQAQKNAGNSLVDDGRGRKFVSESSLFGIKPVSKEGTERFPRAATGYAPEHKPPSVTIVHWRITS
jgi:isocitrate dehydrogenase